MLNELRLGLLEKQVVVLKEFIIKDDPECVTHVFGSNQHTQVRKVSCDMFVHMAMVLTGLIISEKYMYGASLIQTKVVL